MALSAKTLRNSVGKGLPDDQSATGPAGPSLEALVDLVPGLHRALRPALYRLCAKAGGRPARRGTGFRRTGKCPGHRARAPDSSSHAPALVGKSADARSGGRRSPLRLSPAATRRSTPCWETRCVAGKTTLASITMPCTRASVARSTPFARSCSSTAAASPSPKSVAKPTKKRGGLSGGWAASPDRSAARVAKRRPALAASPSARSKRRRPIGCRTRPLPTSIPSCPRVAGLRLSPALLLARLTAPTCSPSCARRVAIWSTRQARSSGPRARFAAHRQQPTRRRVPGMGR